MADNLGTAVLHLEVDDAKYNKGVDSAEKKAQGLKSALGDVAKIAGGFVVAAGLMKLPGLLTDVVGKASDLNESITKAQVVFGSNFEQVDRFAREASTSLGMTRQAALEATGTFGNFLQSMGLAQRQAGDMSMTMVQLAGDLASFNNTSSDEALIALRSGLSGEVEPLRRFGVALSENAVQLELQREGVRKVGAEYTEQQKIQARYNLIMQQTKLAQGDFARTSDGLANSLRILKARVGDVQASIGTALLPVVTRIVNFISNTGIPAFMDFGGALADAAKDGMERLNRAIPKEAVLSQIERLGELVHTLAGDFTALIAPIVGNERLMQSMAEAVGAVASAFTGWQVLKTLAPLLPVVIGLSAPVLAIAAGIAALGGAIYLMNPNLQSFVDLWDTLATTFQGGSVGGELNIFQQSAASLGTVLHDTVMPALREVAEGLRVFGLVLMGGSIGGELSKTQQFAVTAAEAVRAFASGVATAWETAIKPALTALAAWLSDEGSKWAVTFREDIVPAVQSLGEVVMRVVKLIQDNWPTIGPIVQTVASIVLGQIEAMDEGLRGIIHVASEVIQFLSGAFLTDWKGAFEESAKIAREWALGIWENDIKPNVSQLVGYAGKLYNLGVDMVNGVWEGIKATWHSMTDWIGDAADKLPGFIKNPLGINSPSTVMRQVGVDTMQGYIDGLKAKYGDAQQVMAALSDMVRANGRSIGEVRAGTNTTGFYNPQDVIAQMFGTSLENANKVWDELHNEAHGAAKGLSAVTKVTDTSTNGLQRFNEMLNAHLAQLREQGATQDYINGEYAAALDGLYGFQNGLKVSQDWLGVYGNVFDAGSQKVGRATETLSTAMSAAAQKLAADMETARTSIAGWAAVAGPWNNWQPMAAGNNNTGWSGGSSGGGSSGGGVQAPKGTFAPVGNPKTNYGGMQYGAGPGGGGGGGGTFGLVGPWQGPYIPGVGNFPTGYMQGNQVAPMVVNVQGSILTESELIALTTGGVLAGAGRGIIG